MLAETPEEMMRALLGRLTRRTILAAFVAALPWAASAAEIHVMSSGGLTAAFEKLAPVFERRTGHHVVLVLGPSMGTAPEAIPNRLERGERADVLLMVGSALGGLAKAGRVEPESRVDLAESKIAMAVREGAPKPDIATVDGLKRALLAATSIAYSDSASGVYIEREMYDKLGLKAELTPRSRMIVAERVGNVVARGEAEIGFQQVAELLPVKGITIAGELPPEVQKVTIFSAGIPKAARQPAAAAELIAFLGSDEARPTIVETGLAAMPKP
jgi:molybdate transport system substrate-binding protein